ncbi:hypothetical protein DFR40_3157 [Azonexus fungiphilus]|uniref:Uncharacterized protein n=1 Tax=Azonexus fungiphilus TaxID=146940 RepID=A0A495VL22_9RHOO|nr:hypothetical protein [Azonexus fungiphilus]RKT50014.1 hypothetical protein DFR40_3157 [Azonexus fungiphilus]
MKRLCLIAALVAVPALADELPRTPLAASTVDGEKVRLFPNGRWEYVDPAKAEAARKLAADYPENQTRPIDSQGIMVGGIGRYVTPGDKDYNRGSLNPKLR